ncbi:MAG: hypothetical protein CUN57_02130, partial [Phototrophicales bacterium]
MDDLYFNTVESTLRVRGGRDGNRPTQNSYVFDGAVRFYAEDVSLESDSENGWLYEFVKLSKMATGGILVVHGSIPNEHFYTHYVVTIMKELVIVREVDVLLSQFSDGSYQMVNKPRTYS